MVKRGEECFPTWQMPGTRWNGLRLGRIVRETTRGGVNVGRFDEVKATVAQHWRAST